MIQDPTTRLSTKQEVERQIQKEGHLRHCVLYALDLISWDAERLASAVDATTLFMGCHLTPEQEHAILGAEAMYFSAPTALPYDPFRPGLYTWQELLAGWNGAMEDSYDYRIYEHFSQSRFNPPLVEALWQRIHDYSIDAALRELMQFDQEGMTQKRAVGFMGGHSVQRDTDAFYLSARTAQLLGAAGYFVVSGGGPGIMEAANLGAYLAGEDEAALRKAIDLLSESPHYTSPGYHRAGLQVLERFPNGKQSLAIPTWFYGHEPSNVFATHIAKYFSNSIREDTLLAVSLYGIVFAPGSAGTTQEIFMDAAQNHYVTFNFYSPMVFLGKQRYEIETLIYPLLRQLAWEQPYFDLLHLTDEPEEVVRFLKDHPPVQKDA